jgi:hypothetical protein
MSTMFNDKASSLNGTTLSNYQLHGANTTLKATTAGSGNIFSLDGQKFHETPGALVNSELRQSFFSKISKVMYCQLPNNVHSS